MIANTVTAAATASTIVQPKSPQPGPPKLGSGNGLNDQAAVLKPDSDPSPMKTSEPTPAARRPGRRTNGKVAPPSPDASITSTAPTTGEPKIDETAAKLPAAAIRPTACSGASRLTRRIAIVPNPRPTAISGPSGPSTSPRPSVAKAARSTPGRSIGRVGGAARLEPLRGDMTSMPWQPPNRERGQQPRQRDPGKRPPDRDGVIAELPRQVLVHPHLHLVHALEKAPRRGRYEQTHECGEHQQHAVVPAAHQGSRIKRRRRSTHRPSYPKAFALPARGLHPRAGWDDA